MFELLNSGQNGAIICQSPLSDNSKIQDLFVQLPKHTSTQTHGNRTHRDVLHEKIVILQFSSINSKVHVIICKVVGKEYYRDHHGRFFILYRLNLLEIQSIPSEKSSEETLIIFLPIYT